MNHRDGDDRDSFARRLLRLPLVVAVALYFFLDDVVLAAVRPVVAWLAGLRLFERLSAFIHGLGPYPSLLLFAVPFLALQPPKLIALWLIATGRFQVGFALLIASYLVSVVLVERLFHVTRDKLLTIAWFARLYHLVVRLRDWSFAIVRATAAWQAAAALAARIREWAGELKRMVKPIWVEWRYAVTVRIRRTMRRLRERGFR